jgi:methionyl-tRNA formyltransferase
MNIIFFGAPEFSAVILEGLIKGNLKPVLAVAPPDKPVGREQTISSVPAKVLAEKYGIPVLQPENLENPVFKQVLSNAQPDLVVVAAFGPPFLPNWLLSFPKYGCLNLHPSLLPKYRGASPIPYAILNNETETGATIIRLSEKIDQGDILAQEKINIVADETTLTLTQKLADLGSQLLVKTIPLLAKGMVSAQAQGNSPTSYCRRLKKEDGRIDWHKSADFIERQIRAFDPWPGSFTKFSGKVLKVLKAHAITDRISDISPRAIKEYTEPSKSGFVFLSQAKDLAVRAGKDALAIEKLQLEGKKPMSAQDFLRGHKEIVNAKLT